MNRVRLLVFLIPLFLVACSTAVNDQETIGKLRNMHVELEEDKIDGGLEKAMESYQRFLEETPDSSLTPEAIRRLADLKLEDEYGQLNEDDKPAKENPSADLPAPEPAAVSQIPSKGGLADQQTDQRQSDRDSAVDDAWEEVAFRTSEQKRKRNCQRDTSHASEGVHQ